MIIIPLVAAPSQVTQITLNNQSCTINNYQKFFGLFTDIYVSGNLIIAGVLSLNLVFIVRSLYLGFSGDVAFIDTQGTNNPNYTGLGSRYQFVYFAPSELPPDYGQST